MTDDKKSMSEAIEQLQKLAAPPSHPQRGPKPGAKRVAILKDRYKEASPRKPLAKLDVRGRNLLRLMTQGLSIEEEEFAEIIGVEIGEPLEVEQAADVLNIRRKNARWIAEDPLFIRERAVAVKELLAAKKPRAAFRLGKLVDEPGEGSAADRTVQLKAAQAVLGETIAPSRPGVSVTVNNNVQPLAAGIVIRLPQNIPSPPLETKRPEPLTIEHTRGDQDEDTLTELVRRNPHVTGSEKD